MSERSGSYLGRTDINHRIEKTVSSIISPMVYKFQTSEKSVRKIMPILLLILAGNSDKKPWLFNHIMRRRRLWHGRTLFI